MEENQNIEIRNVKIRKIYTEIASGDEQYQIISKEEFVPSQTNQWNTEVRKAMKIKFVNARTINDMFSISNNLSDIASKIVNQDMSKEFILGIDDVKLKNIENNKIKTLIIKIQKVLTKDSKREGYVDSYMMTLLNMLNFDEWPNELIPQYHLSFQTINEKKISSIVEYAIIKNKVNINLIIEDKTVNNTSSIIEWSEPQISGEIVTAAFRTIKLHGVYKQVSYPIIVNAIRVIDTNFTFYKAEVSYNYMKDVLNNLIPIKENLQILRYPPVKGDDETQIPTFWNICIEEDRKNILLSLESMIK